MNKFSSCQTNGGSQPTYQSQGRTQGWKKRDRDWNDHKWKDHDLDRDWRNNKRDRYSKYVDHVHDKCAPLYDRDKGEEINFIYLENVKNKDVLVSVLINVKESNRMLREMNNNFHNSIKLSPHI